MALIRFYLGRQQKWSLSRNHIEFCLFMYLTKAWASIETHEIDGDAKGIIEKQIIAFIVARWPKNSTTRSKQV